MASRPQAQTHVETLIARGRVALAVFVVAAFRLSPVAADEIGLTSFVTLTYLAHAFGLLVLTRTSLVASAKWPSATHALDLALLAAYLFAGGGRTIPFVAWFAFVLVAATLRWAWRGAIGTGSLALMFYAGLGIRMVGMAPPPAVAQYIMTALLLGILMVLVGLVGAYEDWRGRQLARLAAWSAPNPTQPAALAAAMLEQAAAVLEVPRTMIVLEDADEPWTEIVVWQQGRSHRYREPPGTFGDVVGGELAESSFFCRDVSAARPVTYFREGSRLRTRQGIPVDDRLRERFAIRAIGGWTLKGDDFRGWLFCLDRPAFSEQDLVMGQVVADLAEARLEQAYLLQRLRDAAVSSERLRLARDLHDGVLQTLTGAALQVQTARRLLAQDARGAEDRLSQVQRVLAGSQNDLRSFIQQLGPQPVGEPTGPIDLSGRVLELADRIRRQWGVPLTVATEPQRLEIPDDKVQELFLLIHEGLVNAARHARATSIQLAILRSPHDVSVSVVDDGRGFPFTGSYTMQELSDRNIGPRSLRARVATLGGTLTIDTSSKGTRLSMTVPLVKEIV
jgi:signal transduction histidine kinase